MEKYVSDDALEFAHQITNHWPWQPDPDVRPPTPPPRWEGATRGGCTLGEVADELGCTKERVRQIEGQALQKLRSLMDWYGLTMEDLVP